MLVSLSFHLISMNENVFHRYGRPSEPDRRPRGGGRYGGGGGGGGGRYGGGGGGGGGGRRFGRR